MYEQEKQRATHLMILLCYTVFAIVLTGESILLGWELAAVVLILLGLIVSWVIHITGKVSEQISLWVYFALMMLTFFFYGIHESSMYDLAPVMVVVIFMYYSTEMNSLINLCVITYYLTMCYDFVFVAGDSLELNSLMVTRTLLHFALVYMAGYLAKIIIRRNRGERKNTEGKIKELEETNRKTENFLTNVSHELRTPINAVIGITSVMMKTETDTGRRKDISAIQMAGHRLFDQIEDILDYTEIDTGRIRVSEDSYMISSIVNDIITGNRMYEKEEAPELIFDIDAGIPSMLLGDGRKIKKILKHLVDNAVKFTQKGGVYVRIYALQKDYGINLCICVEDTGIGIGEEELEKITERFYQSNGGRNRRAGGLGLGIPIVYGMVAAMEGFIQIESAAGSGTRVSVSIPQKVSDGAPCMVVENREKLCMACFLRPEKYEVPKVRKYYEETIAHLVHGLEIELHRVSNLDEMKKMIARYSFTHLFIGKEEYEETPAFFENMDKNTEVIVVADDKLFMPEDSRMRLLRKPFYSLPIINMLNSEPSEDVEPFQEMQMICPNIRALVVDDEPMNLMVSEGIFKDYQMGVMTAGSGKKAIEICEKEDFDLIFLDHMMPEMDGVETLKRLLKLYSETDKVPAMIAFTANAVSGAREMFLREGFDEFLSKPIERLELERVLKKVLPKASVKFVDGNNAKVGAKELNGKEIPEEDGDGKMRRLADAGFQTHSGIAYCRGDMQFYEELLVKFGQDAEKKATDINSFYEKGDFDNYHILVHALKSVSKMVGAYALSDMAKKLEEASKDGNTAFIKEHHEELLMQYRNMAQCIREVFELQQDIPELPDIKEGVEMSKEELLVKLKELKESLNTYEADKAESQLQGMSQGLYQGVAVAELLRDAGQDIEDFEFSAASEKVEALMERLEGGEYIES